MTNASKFLETVINCKHRVYGYKLRPFTLFHAAYLEFRNNPLLVGGTISPEAVLEAAIVCSSKNADEITGKLNSRIVGLKLLTFRQSKQVENWCSYFSDFFSLPDCWPSNDGKKDPLPFFLTTATAIIKQTGWSFDDVFYKLSLGQVIWLNLSFNYLESGKTSVISDDEAATMAFVKALQGEGNQ